MSKVENLEVYKNEELASEAFKEYRIKKGIVCKKCGSTEHYWLDSKSQFQCKICRFRTTLRSGTIIEGSKLPISYFFIALHLILKYGNDLTTEKFQEAIEHKYYDSIWDFLRKMKEFVKNNDRNTIMIDFIEVINSHYVKQLHILEEKQKSDNNLTNKSLS